MSHPDELYRDRWLSAFTATYSTVAVISTGFIAIAAILWPEAAHFPLLVVIGLSLIQLFLVLLLFRMLRELYDKLAYWTPKFETEDEYQKIYAQEIGANVKSKRRRKFFELLIHILFPIQVAFLVYAFLAK